MRADGDLDAQAIVAFTLAVLGMVGAGGALSGAAVATLGAEDTVEITTSVIGVFVVAAVTPIVAGITAWSAKNRIDRAKRPVGGYGLATAAQTFVVLALLTLVVSAFTLWAETDVEFAGADTTADEPPAESQVWGPGDHFVPEDMPPGFYRAQGGQGCFWQRLASYDFTPAGDGDVIADGTDPFVEIESGDAGFFSEGCGTWRRSG